MHKGKCAMLTQKISSILFLMQVVTVHASGLSVTEGMIKEAMLEVDASITSKDINRLSKTLADKAILEVHQITPCGEHKKNIRKEQFLNGTIQAWGTNDYYKYKRIESVILIENNKLVSKSMIREKFVLNGKAVTLISKDVITYEEKDGHAIAVSIIATVNSDVCI
jgi:hypothetical protein